MAVALNSREEQLFLTYQRIFEQKGRPEWAFKYFPSIPLVGKHLEDKARNRCSVLVYGSAENLTYTINNQKAAINSLGSEQYFRHRYYFENSKGKSDFFPKSVHIAPIEDGSLITIARYILFRLGYDKHFSWNPLEFVEQIAVGNVGKFSVWCKTNIDYPPKDHEKLSASLEYLKADLAIIQPSIIIMPKTIFNNIEWKLGGFKAIKDESLFNNSVQIIKCYQTNPRPINIAITRQIKKAGINIEAYNLNPKISAWIDKVRMSNRNNTVYNKAYIRKLMTIYVRWLDFNFDESENEDFIQQIE